MKASETPFRFPVLGFKPDANLGEVGHVFPDLESLTVCSASDLKYQVPENLDLIDAAGARWTVKSVTRLRRHGGLARWLLTAPLGWQRYRIDFDLEPLAAVTLAEVQERVCAIEQAFGELDDYNEDHQAETASRLAKIRSAKTIARVAKLAEWDGF